MNKEKIIECRICVTIEGKEFSWTCSKITDYPSAKIYIELVDNSDIQKPILLNNRYVKIEKDLVLGEE